MANDTHVLYRFYDQHGQLLYVGITNDPAVRFRSHQGNSSWYRKVARGTMEHFKTRNDLEAAEIKAIQTEQPKYNQRYSVAPPPNTIGISSSRGHSPTATSVFGPDAHHFKAPDAIADDDTDDIETLDAKYPPPQPRTPQPLPCLVCHSAAVWREYDDLVRCDTCLNMWTWEEWYQLNYVLPTP